MPYQDRAKPEPPLLLVSIPECAQMLGLSLAYVRTLLDDRTIDSRYEGRRRLVVVESMRDYVAGLPQAPRARADAS